MKKLQKIKLDELAGIELNEKGLCRILGGGTPGNCQCGCLYADAGGAESADNDAANSAGGQYSTTCPQSGCGEDSQSIALLCDYTPTPQHVCSCVPQDVVCGGQAYCLY